MDTSLQKHSRVVLLVAVTYCVANGQNRRTVKEPTIPPRNRNRVSSLHPVSAGLRGWK